jgi:hypothetical protein
MNTAGGTSDLDGRMTEEEVRQFELALPTIHSVARCFPKETYLACLDGQLVTHDVNPVKLAGLMIELYGSRLFAIIPCEALD